MPYLIDGNNLMFALADAGCDAGRGRLCKMLGEFSQRDGQRVKIVFDGPEPAGPLAEQVGDERIEVGFSGRRTADAVIMEAISADTAPRRLIVVSSDHEIRTAAHRRRCLSLSSRDFARLLLHRPAKKSTPGEPRQKSQGLAPGELEEWLKDLDLE